MRGAKSTIALVVLTWCAFALAPQAQQRPAAPQATGAVSGAVTAAATGQPVRRAQIRLVSTSPAITRQATTDDAGRFVVSNVPAGTFALSASKPGFLEMVYGARKPGASMAGKQIQIAAGQQVEGLQIELARGSVITGTITDEFGDPAFNTAVRVMRYVFSNGQRYATTFGQQDFTDDRGAYRIAGLMPGDYVVSAVPRDVVSQAMATLDMMRDRYVAVRAAGNENRTGADILSMTVDPRGYVPVHYPGTVRAADAAVVHVGPDAEVAGVDIRLQVVHTANVTGTIISAEGAVPASSRIQLLDPAMAMPTLGSWWTGLRPGDKFVFYGVTPGSYVVRTHSTVGGSDLFASAEIQVDSGRAIDVELRLQRGVSVSGTVVLSGVPVTPSRVRVLLYPVSTVADPEVGMERASLDAAGRFVFRGLVPARYRVAFEGLPAGWSLATARFGEWDAADQLLEIAADRNLTGGLLTLTSKSAEITGVVTNPMGQPVAEGVVLVFPDDPRLWVPQSRRIHNVPLSTGGRYAVRGLPPGTYRVAVADPEPHQWFDKEYLTQLLSLSTSVTLAEGEKKAHDLRVR